jgi:2-methylcitrate dehydratase PrpD
MAQHRFTVDALLELRVLAPPLVMQLVDRAPHADMAPSYARLCLPYIVATALMRGTVDVLDFEPHALRDPERLALAARIRPILDRNPAVNALAPQRVEATLRDGRELAIDLPAVLGAPGRPLSREQHLAKFRRAASSGAQSFDATRIARLIEQVDELDTIDDMRSLIDLMT